MSRFFYPGCRVRKARGTTCVGMTATVFEVGAKPGPRSLGVLPDAAGTITHGDQVFAHFQAGQRLWADPELFDPILPYGLEANAEIAALWFPSPDKVKP